LLIGLQLALFVEGELQVEVSIFLRKLIDESIVLFVHANERIDRKQVAEISDRHGAFAVIVNNPVIRPVRQG
jgi:hypothetical protein